MARIKFILVLVVLAALCGCVDSEAKILRDRLVAWQDSIDCISVIGSEADAQIYTKMRKPLLDEKLDKIGKRWTNFVANLGKKEGPQVEGLKIAFKGALAGQPPPDVVMLPAKEKGKEETPITFTGYQKSFLEEVRITREVLKKEMVRMQDLPSQLAARKQAEYEAAGETPDPNALNFPAVKEVVSSLKSLESMFTLE